MVILLVEDNVAVQLLIWRLLKEDGFTVLNADSSEAALEASRGHLGSIDMLLSDVLLPHADGLALSNMIAAERPGIKVLMMSGNLRIREGVSTHSLPFIQKPFTLAALRNSIDMVLGAMRSTGH